MKRIQSEVHNFGVHVCAAYVALLRLESEALISQKYCWAIREQVLVRDLV